jgi:hypothetical protein
VQQCQADQARIQLDSILHYLETNPTLAGAVEPLRILLICCDTLQALADERAVDILERSYRPRQDQAARLTDESLKQSFLQHVPTHARIIAAWTATSRAAG